MKVYFCVIVVGALILVGCGDSGADTNSSMCSECVNGEPSGPSASVEACDAWGAGSNCETSTLTNAGACGGSIPASQWATCTVTNCADEPSCD